VGTRAIQEVHGGGVCQVNAPPTRPSRQSILHQHGRSALSRAIHIPIPGRRRHARNEDPERRCTAPVPPRCKERKAAGCLMDSSAGVLLRSPELPLVRSLVCGRSDEHSHAESGSLEENHLHPDLRRERRILRPRSAFRCSRSEAARNRQDVTWGGRDSGICAAGNG
jgi:hypothetical protein